MDASLAKFLANGFQRRAYRLLDRQQQDLKAPASVGTTAVSRTQEVKRLWFAHPLPPAIPYSKTAKLDQPCFRGISRLLKKARARVALAKWRPSSSAEASPSRCVDLTSNKTSCSVIRRWSSASQTITRCVHCEAWSILSWLRWIEASTACTPSLERASIALERLLRASLLQVIYTIRSERQLVEQVDFNLQFRWFEACRRTSACGITRPSARTATGCSSRM